MDIERALPRCCHRQEVRLGLIALKKRPNDADRLAAVIECAVDARESLAYELCCTFDTRACRQKHSDPTSLLYDLVQKAVVEERQRILAHDLHIRRFRRIERRALEHCCCVEVRCVEGRIHRRRQADETTAHSLGECEAELELRGCLVDLIDHQCVGRQNVTVLKPSAGNSGRYDDDVPGWRLGCRFPLSIDDADPESSCAKNGFGNRPNRKRFTGAGASDDAEAVYGGRQLPDPLAVLLLQNRRYVQAERKLDRLTGSARRSDDDQSPGRRLGSDKGLMIRRKVSVGYVALHAQGKGAYIAPDAKRPQGLSSSGAVAMTSRDLVSAFLSFTLAVTFSFGVVVAVLTVAGDAAVGGCLTADVDAIAVLI